MKKKIAFVVLSAFLFVLGTAAQQTQNIDPEAVKTMSTTKKGIFGEIIANQYMEQKGYKNMLPPARIKRSLNDAPGGAGIDGVYKKPSAKSRPLYIVAEIKYRTETNRYIDSDGTTSTQLLSTVKGNILQMSDRWIEDRLPKTFGDEAVLDNIRNKKYDSWLIIVGPNGRVEQITVLDSTAKAIGTIKP